MTSITSRVVGCMLTKVSWRTPTMKTIDTTGWTWELGTLDEWNGEPEHHFRIVQKGEVVDGTPSSTALVRFAVAGSANFLDPFKKNIRPFVKSRFVNILRACGAQSLHLLLIHHVEASYPEDRFHGFTIQTR